MTAATDNAAAVMPWWGTALIALVSASIPALISYLASRENRQQAKNSAQAALKQADDARASAEEIERLRRLEDRVRDAKVKAYMPLIKVIGQLMQGGPSRNASEQARLDQNLRDAINNFWMEGIVYSSDRMQRAMGRLMQGTFTDAPPAVVLRLASELLLAARLDLGDDRSEISLTEIWAPKIKDLFSGEHSMTGFDQVPFSELARREGWQAPWRGSVLDHRDEEDPAVGV